jgi:hypothetical protein
MFSLPNFTEFIAFASIIPVYLAIVFFLISQKTKKGQFNKRDFVQKKA